MATARWITMDPRKPLRDFADTAARHARKDGFTTQIGDGWFDGRLTVFRTGPLKSREAFLSVLRAGRTDCVVNAAAPDTMRGHSLHLALSEFPQRGRKIDKDPVAKHPCLGVPGQLPAGPALLVDVGRIQVVADQRQ